PELRDAVPRREAGAEVGQQRIGARRARRLDVPAADAEHLVIEPSVDHCLPEPPLIADLDRRKGTFGRQLQHGPLVEVEIARQLLHRHQAVIHLHPRLDQWVSLTAPWYDT